MEESKVKEAASTRKLLESSESVAKLEKVNHHMNGMSLMFTASPINKWPTLNFLSCLLSRSWNSGLQPKLPLPIMNNIIVFRSQ